MVFFFHCPFPTSEIFRALQTGSELLHGVLSADVVGFHVFDHARHFLTACKRYLGLSVKSKGGGNLCVDHGGRSVMVTICHVSVDTAMLTREMADPHVQSIAAELRKKYAGKRIIGSVDPCHRLSGLACKLLAFERLLTDYPVYQKKVRHSAGEL